MTKEEENYQWMNQLARDYGASLFGVADIKPIESHFLLSREELKDFKYGIALGVRLSPAVLNGILDKPTLLYKWHYRQANNYLDRVARRHTRSCLVSWARRCV